MSVTTILELRCRRFGFEGTPAAGHNSTNFVAGNSTVSRICPTARGFALRVPLLNTSRRREFPGIDEIAHFLFGKSPTACVRSRGYDGDGVGISNCALTTKERSQPRLRESAHR